MSVDVSIQVLQRRMDAALDPLLSFKWVCTELPYGMDPTYVEEVSMPFLTIQPKEGLFGAGTYSYYPGFEDISAFDVTFYEDSVMTTTKWLKEWKERIRRPSDGCYYLPGYYKQNIVVKMMDTTGKVIATVTLKNCWPTGRSNWDLNYTSDGRLTVQQNFSVDDQEVEFG